MGWKGIKSSFAFPSAAGTRIIATRAEELPRIHSDTSESAATLGSLLQLSSSITQGNWNQATRTSHSAESRPQEPETESGNRIMFQHPTLPNGDTAMSPDSNRSLWRRHHSESRVRASQHQPPFYYVAISTYSTLPAFGYTSGLTR